MDATNRTKTDRILRSALDSIEPPAEDTINMDPEACLMRAYRAANNHDLEEADAALADYCTWRTKGGFEPELGDIRARALTAWLRLEEP